MNLNENERSLKGHTSGFVKVIQNFQPMRINKYGNVNKISGGGEGKPGFIPLSPRFSRPIIRMTNDMDFNQVDMSCYEYCFSQDMSKFRNNFLGGK